MFNPFDDLQQIDPSHAQPGEIWEVSRSIKSPLQQSHPFSKIAQQFLCGQSRNRYVMIVRPPNPLLEAEWQEITVMVLSSETSWVSQVDVLIPAAISGLEQDVLAETWHVLPMLHCNLLRPIGNRLSRSLYDRLLNLGDAYHGLIEPLEPVELTASSQIFHQQEQAWSEVLSFPIMDYRTWAEAETAIDKTLEVERVLSQLTTTPITSARILLRRWFKGQVQAGWLTFEELLDAGVLRSPSVRSQEDANIENSVEVCRMKLIDLGMQMSRKTVALSITVTQKPDQHQIGVMLRVYPTGSDLYLPESLRLILIENQEQRYEVVARRTDLYVQLKFNAQISETFSVQVALGETGITENFMF